MPDNQLPAVKPGGSQPDAPVQGGVPQGGTTPGGQSDAGKVDLSRYVPKEDLNRMRSSYDTKIAAQTKAYEELKAQYQGLQEWREKNETEGLTDEELAAYMAEKQQYEANRRIAEAQQKQAEAEYQANVMALKSYYLGLGAPATVLSIEDPAEMQDAFLKFLIKRAETAEKSIDKSTAETKTPPPVTTHKPAAGSMGKVKFSELKLGSKEEREFFAKIDSGAIKLEDVDFS